MERADIVGTDHHVSLSRGSQMAFPEAELDTMRIGDIELDPARRTVRTSGRRIHLTPKEFELVQQLMSNPGRPSASIFNNDAGCRGRMPLCTKPCTPGENLRRGRPLSL